MKMDLGVTCQAERKWKTHPESQERAESGKRERKGQKERQRREGTTTTKNQEYLKFLPPLISELNFCRVVQLEHPLQMLLLTSQEICKLPRETMICS